nr:OmpW family outer membrane protein [uncultured Sphingomonas sp.]
MKKTFLLAAAAVIALPSAAFAQDAKTADGGLSAGDKLVRIRAITVIPQESSSGISPTFPGEHVKVSNAVAPEVDFTYMITDNVGVELIAATTKHKASGKTGTTGSIGKLASTWVLPPTLTLNYHFNAKGTVRPYIGVGVNYTIFYSEKASGDLEAAVGKTKVSMSDSFGPAVQAGVDVAVGPNSFFNLDAKWIDMDTKATLRTTALGTQKVKVHIDPLVVGVGFGWRF